MCILAVALNCHPAFPFICAHNREESRDRPSCDEQLELDTQIVCGRDLTAGGMVMGLHAGSGHLAALTNVRTPVKQVGPPTSRGTLVERLVIGGPAVMDELCRSHTWDGFHVVFGDVFGTAPRLHYCWNAPVDGCVDGRILEEGDDARWASGSSELRPGRVFVVSNENPAMADGSEAKSAAEDGLTAGAWPKCCWLQRSIAQYLASLPDDPKVEDVHAGLARIMGLFDSPDVDPPHRLPKFYPEEQEVLLHTGPFSPWRKQFQKFGTVSQRIVVSDARCQEACYFHRSTNVGWDAASPDRPPSCGDWQCLVLPWRAAGTGARDVDASPEPKRARL